MPYKTFHTESECFICLTGATFLHVRVVRWERMTCKEAEHDVSPYKFLDIKKAPKEGVDRSLGRCPQYYAGEI